MFTFLTQAAEPLLRIDNIENYLRAVDTKKDIDTTKDIVEIKGYESINKLQNEIKEFNDYVQRFTYSFTLFTLFGIRTLTKETSFKKLTRQEHYLFEADLSGADLSEAKLPHANLSGADLSEAKLFEADLSGADLSGADLSFAKLSGADLPNAKLFQADLSFAKLSGADLFQADLSGADLRYANLSGADSDLSNANLSNANLSGADSDLSNANLSNANLSGADLSEAKLSGANLTNSVIISSQNYESLKLNEKTNFADAITNDTKFIYCIGKFSENIPEIVNNRKDLKSKLKLRTIFNEEQVEEILINSGLPEE